MLLRDSWVTNLGGASWNNLRAPSVTDYCTSALAATERLRAGVANVPSGGRRSTSCDSPRGSVDKPVRPIPPCRGMSSIKGSSRREGWDRPGVAPSARCHSVRARTARRGSSRGLNDVPGPAETGDPLAERRPGTPLVTGVVVERVATQHHLEEAAVHAAHDPDRAGNTGRRGDLRGGRSDPQRLPHVETRPRHALQMREALAAELVHRHTTPVDNDRLRRATDGPPTGVQRCCGPSIATPANAAIAPTVSAVTVSLRRPADRGLRSAGRARVVYSAGP